MRVTAIITTLNEEQNLRELLPTLAHPLVDVVVVDSGSEDRSVDVARDHGACVVEHPYASQAQQLNWALDTLSVGDWVLVMDADERLAEGIDQVIALSERLGVDRQHSCAAFRRRNFFGSTWLRWAGFWPDWQVRLLRPNLRYEPRDIHAHVDVPASAIYFCKEIVIDHLAYASAEDYLAKMVRYVAQEAADSRDGPSTRPRYRRIRSLSDRLPARPVVRFFYMYVVRAGFLQGRLGWYLSLWSAEKETMKSGHRSLTRRDKDAD